MAEADAGFITASQAAARTGYSKQHILKLLNAGKLEGRQIGSFWVTTVAAVDTYLLNRSKPGRPPGRTTG